MEWMVGFSTWIENNSGQIQIGLGLFALWLAWSGYRKVIDQMDIAKNQRYFELHIKILSEFWQVGYVARQSITKYKDVIFDYELFIEDCMKNQLDDCFLKIVKDAVKQLKEQEKSVEDMESRINTMLNKFKESECLDIQLMQNFLSKLTSISFNLNKISESPERMKISLRKLKERVF